MNSDTLYDLLVGIDQRASASLMNKQLIEIADKVKDLKVKVKIDKGYNKDLKAAVLEMENMVPKTAIGLQNSNLMVKHIDEINQVMDQYKKLGATVTKYSENADGDIKEMIVTVKDLQQNIQKVTFAHVDGELKEKSSTFFSSFDQNLKELRVGLKLTEAEYKKVALEMAAGRGNEDLAVREIELKKKLSNEYGKLLLEVHRYNGVSKEQKSVLMALVSEEAKASEQSIKRAQAVGESQRKYRDAQEAVKQYKTELVALTNVQLGKDNSRTEDDVQRTLNGLKEMTTGYQALEREIIALEQTQSKTFNTKQVQAWETGYTRSTGIVEKGLKDLETAYINLDYAETRGQEGNVQKQVNNIERLKASILEAGNEVLDFGQKLGKLDNDTDLESIGVDFQKIESQMRDTSAQADYLNQTFGKIIKTTRSGAGAGGAVSQFMGGPQGEAEMKRLGEAIYGVGAEYVKSAKDGTHFQQMTRNITYSVQDADGVWRKYTLTLDQAEKQLRETKIETDTTKKAVQGFAAQLGEAAKKIATWGISTKIVYGTWRAFQEGIKTIQELDGQLTQIAIVQGKGRVSTKELGDEYVKTALKMSQSVQEVAKLNTELIRQGLSLTDASERADTIMKLSSAGMVSMEQSLQVITTGVNALGETHQKVADVILKASMLSASDVEGLGEAFTKTASGAKAAGLTIEQTSALLATMKEVTQEGDSQLGTSLKSMLARFNKINEETGELNEDLNKVQTAIESVGIEFLDAEGQIRSFYDIVGELSLVWDDLDKNTQAYVATQAAGVRQQNRFFAVMDNFNKVQAINNDLTDAAGTLQQSYATYLDSSEAASKRLKTAMDQLWMNFIDSDAIVGLTNVATGLVKIVDAIGPLALAFMAVSIKIALSTTTMKEFFVAAKTGAPLAVSGIKVLGLGFTNLVATIQGAKATLATFGTTLVAVLPTMAAFMAAGFALGKIVEVFTNIKQSADEAKQAQVDFYNSTIDMVKGQNTQRSNISSLGEEYLELKDKVQSTGGIYSLTSQELDRYYGVQRDLKEIIPELSSYEDARGNILLNNVSNVNELTTAYDKYLQTQVDIAAIGWEDRWNEGIKEQQKSVKELKGDMSDLLAELAKDGLTIDKISKKVAYAYANPVQESIDAFASASSKVQAYYAKENQMLIQSGANLMSSLRLELLSEMGSFPDELARIMSQDSFLIKMSGKSAQEAKDYVYSVKNSINTALAETDILEGISSVSDIFAEVERLGQEHLDGFIDAETYAKKMSAITEALNTILLTATGEQAEIIKYALESLEGMGAEASRIVEESAEEIAKRKAEGLEEASAAYQKSSQSAMEYYEALEKLNDKEISSIEIQDMILNDFPQYAALMNDKIALSQALTQGMMDEDEVRAQSYINMLLNTESFTNATGGAYAQLMVALKGYYQGDISSYSQLENIKASITTKLINALNEQWGKYFHAVNGYIEVNRQALIGSVQMQAGFRSGAEATAFFNNQVSHLNKQAADSQAEINKITGAIDSFRASIDIPDFKNFTKELNDAGKAGKKAGAGGKDAAKGAKEAGDAAKKAAADLKAYNEAMKATQDATKDVFDFALEYIESIKEKKIKALEEATDAAKKLTEEEYDDLIKKIEQRSEAELKILSTKEEALKAEKETEEYTRKRQALQGDLVDLEYRSALASLDGSVSGISKRRTLEKELADKRKELDDTVRDREEQLRTEAFARQRQFIQDEAEWERAQAEITKTAKILDLEEIHKKEMSFIDEKYSAENNYLAARQAVQTGMIANLHGDMIPLVQAFKELAIENGKFWTFFGQQEVKEFGAKVTTVMDAVKKLGFETIQVWKEVKSAVDDATAAAGSSSGGSGSSGGGGGGSYSGGGGGGGGVSAPAASAGTSQKEINKLAQNWMAAQMKRFGLAFPSGWAIDGSFGNATKAVAQKLKDKNDNNHSEIEYILGKIAGGSQASQDWIDKMNRYGLKAAAVYTPPKTSSKPKTTSKPNSSNTGSHQSYSQGGKIDYTGPASVHGSKSKPEYVFNYQQFKDLARMIAKHELIQPVRAGAAQMAQPLLSIENFITVQGNIDKNTLPEFKKASDDAIAKLAGKLKGWGK